MTWVFGATAFETVCPGCGQLLEKGRAALYPWGTHGEEGATCDIGCLLDLQDRARGLTIVVGRA